MTDPISKQSAPQIPPPFKFDEVALRAHLEKVCDSQNKYVGMKNHNPYIWIAKNVKPLVNRLDGKNEDGSKGVKDTSETFAKAIMALPLNHVPIINPTLVDVPTTTEPKQEAPKLSPTGLNL